MKFPRGCTVPHVTKVDLKRNIFREGGFTEMVCEDCADEYEECPHCGELTENRTICLACGAVIDEKEETA